MHDLPIATVIPYAGLLYKTDANGQASPADTEGNVSDPLVNQQIAANLASTGWLACDGQKLAVRAYPLLFGVIGNIYGGGGNGEEQWFKVPDYRGYFLRATDAGAGRDPDARDRTAPGDPAEDRGDKVGSVQLDAFQGHQHNYTMPAMPTPVGAQAPSPLAVPNVRTQSTQGFVTNNSDGTPRTASETRSKNIYVNYLIKAF